MGYGTVIVFDDRDPLPGEPAFELFELNNRILRALKGLDRMYLDHWGLIVQKDFDGGDSLQRGASYALVKAIAARMKVDLPVVRYHEPLLWPQAAHTFYEVSPGVYRRHPDLSKWYSEPRTTSRDQLLPTIIALGAVGDFKGVRQLQWAILKRGLFAQNIYRNWDPISTQEKKTPDTFVGHLHVFFRAWGSWSWIFWPLLLVLDLWFFIATLISAIPIHVDDEGHFTSRDPDDADDMNAINQHLQALAFAPTPFSWLARKAYAKLREETYGSIRLGETNAVQGALAWYNRADSGGNPEMGELYRPLVSKYFA